MEKSNISAFVKKYLEEDLSIIDYHTHLFPEEFGDLDLNGFDNILNYHYLHAELFATKYVGPNEFYSLSESKQAEVIWDQLFVKRLPISEATLGVLTILKKFDITIGEYNYVKQQFSQVISGNYIGKVLELANVESIVMTCDIFDPKEVEYYDRCCVIKPFIASIRVDGFRERDSCFTIDNVTYDISNDEQLKDYVSTITKKLKPIYFAISIDDVFDKGSETEEFLEKFIFPLCHEHNIPMNLMIGVQRGVNPDYRLAGDTVQRANVNNLARVLKAFPSVMFNVTMLSRENQYEVTVLSRKFANLGLFGVWWFLNNDLFIEEITRMRMNLLGGNFIPQHSDARVLEHLIYKWQHSLRVIEPVLVEFFERLHDSGYPLNESIIGSGIDEFFNGQIRKQMEDNKCLTC
ncbi:glucuronate isomerase [Vibrio mediterranei]|uniref:glucuronate isomerase n=1 Tax=Vibrio mediterranei TaxID=689 RepID=UPI00148C48E1|nr:glucuronate isomerase [Vibrio mediterranei]NOI23991.1 glucuronate isomerase [Vibrio mediterranei]